MRRTLTVLLLVTISLLCVVEAARNVGLSSAVTDSDLNDIKSVVQSYTNSKDWPNNIHTAYYVTSALANLDKIPKQDEVIALAKNTLKSKEKLSLESIYHAVSILETLKVSDATVEKTVVDTLVHTIEDGDSLIDFYYAGSAALSLRALKLAKDIKEDDLTSLVAKVVDLAEEDGAFRSSPTDKEGSLYNAGLALQLLARLVKETKLSEEDQEHIDSTVELVESIISLGNEGDNTLEFATSDGDVNALTTTSVVFVGLSSFAAATKKPLPEVTPLQVTQIGQYLINHKQVGTLTDAFHLLNGLRALQNNVISIPVAVALERASIVGTAKGSEGNIRVKVTDVFDKPVTGAKVYLIKAQPTGKDTHVLLSNQDLILSDDKKVFTLNFLAAKPDQGFYSLEFRVVPSDSKYATVDSAIRTVKVVGSISITDLDIAVADSKELLSKSSESSLYKAADQSHKIDEVIRIDHLQFVNIKFRVRGAGGSNKPVVVQQAFVKLTHIKTGHEAIFVAQPNDNKVYSVLIDVEEASKTQFKSHSGDYKLEVVAGDAFIQNPVHWVVSTNVKITFLTNATSSRTALGSLPEIAHKFREPESRPPKLVSNVATLLVLSPLLFLFIGFIAVGANISQFPFSGLDFIYSVGFLASVGATLGLMGLYWLKLNLVQTLGYLAVLAVPNVFFGQRALSRLAKRKDKTE